jgi:hypothetical protein
MVGAVSRCRLIALLTALLLVLEPPSPARADGPTIVPNPVTVRLWATREGLVGRPTSSGHVIQPNDHFVALPSRRAVGQRVRVSYQGRTQEAPVLDVGPWNRDDAWWEEPAARGQFPDLPRWVPEAWVAWDQGYNGGRDAVGRWVSFPVLIDLGDGLAADLGLTKADWVDVTLLWVPGTSPPPLAPADRVIQKKPDPSVPHDQRYFEQTGYRVDSDPIWGYFQARGREQVFGYPVSRTFMLLGCQAQIFQRQVAQVCAGQGAALMNLLDPDVFPYSRVNGSQLPPVDAVLKAQTPVPSRPDYAAAMLDFVRANAPDAFDDQPVGFGRTFFGLITAQMAGRDDPLFDLEVWGAPISRPARDPANSQFVYQRFQRGVMHFDGGTGRTAGLLLADYLKQVMRDRDLPADLRQQAQGTRFFAQYCVGAPRWLCRPADLPATDLTLAFEPG